MRTHNYHYNVLTQAIAVWSISHIGKYNLCRCNHAAITGVDTLTAEKITYGLTLEWLKATIWSTGDWGTSLTSSYTLTCTHAVMRAFDQTTV